MGLIQGMFIKYYSRSLVLKFLVSLVMLLLFDTTPSRAATAKTFLWEISGNGLHQPSYLYGTTHMGCAEKLALSKQQQKALNSVKQLYLELDRYQSSDNTIPNGKTLQDLMNPNDYLTVKNFFTSQQLSFPKEKFQIYNKTRPVPLADMIDKNGLVEAYMKYCKTSKRNIKAKEDILLDAADQRKIPTFGIETPKDRIIVEEKISLQDQIGFLLIMMHVYQGRKSDSADQSVEYAEKILADQDIDKFPYYLNPIYIENRVLEAPIDRRNRLWIPRMCKAMKKKSTFFGFGAGHLGTEHGLIALLKAEGYRLRPIFDKN
jgi:uncharacterized protein